MLEFQIAEIEAALEVDEDRLEQEHNMLNHKMIADIPNQYTMLDAEEFSTPQCSLSHE